MVKRNVYEQIASLYDLTLNEPFHVDDELFTWGKITEEGVYFTDDILVTDGTTWVQDTATEVRIYLGELTVNSAWQPAVGDAYYFVQNKDGAVRKTIFDDDETLDALNMKAHNYFKSLDVCESQKEFVIERVFGTVDTPEENSGSSKVPEQENSDLTN